MLILMAIVMVSGKAQVTIGAGIEPHVDALLDLKEDLEGVSTKGLLLPRVELTSTEVATPLSSHVEGMTVYNKATDDDVTPGYYYNDGFKWVRLMPEAKSLWPAFFYMPSFVLPVDPNDDSYSETNNRFEIELHELYLEQFVMEKGSSVKSPSATEIPIVESSEDLEYYIVYYDQNVFENVEVSDGGLLTYNIKSESPITEKTFMNIVLRLK